MCQLHLERCWTFCQTALKLSKEEKPNCTKIKLKTSLNWFEKKYLKGPKRFKLDLKILRRLKYNIKVFVITLKEQTPI